MLSDVRGNHGIEVVALNGEDHYSAGGQMDYLRRYESEFGSILLAINVDDVGYRKGRSAYSFYGCSPALQHRAEDVFRGFSGLVEGQPWFSGDHMIFVQQGVPSLAVTAENMMELMMTVTHTSRDTPELIDHRKLVEVSRALSSLIRAI